MQAFTKNIDALEQKLDEIFQKWKILNDERELLIQRNKQLEERLRNDGPGKTGGNTAKTGTGRGEDALDPTYIINAIDQYVSRIDDCIDQINMELDGGQ